MSPVSRFTAVCVRFVNCINHPLTFLGAFSRRDGGVDIGAWTIPKSGKFLQEKWSVESNATVVGQMVVLSEVETKKGSKPTVVVTTSQGVLAVQSN